MSERSSTPDRTRVEILVDALLAATARGGAEWHVGDTYQVVVYRGPDGSVVLYPVNGDEKAPYALEVRDQEGAVLDARVTAYTANRESLTPLSRQIDELYHQARDAAVAPVVDSILEELGGTAGTRAPLRLRSDGRG